MVGYWMYKYQKNEDITLVEYKSLDKIKEAIYPEPTICFVEPFLTNESLYVTKDRNFSQKYNSYLSGKKYDDNFKQIEYDQVTPNLTQYFDRLRVLWKPEKNY